MYLDSFTSKNGDQYTLESSGGRTTPENCQMLCAECNRRKSDV